MKLLKRVVLYQLFFSSQGMIVLKGLAHKKRDWEAESHTAVKGKRTPVNQEDGQGRARSSRFLKEDVCG